MSKPSDVTARRLILALLLLPGAVWCGVTPLDGPPPAERPAGSYQLRCWQLGRLLFEENHVTLPPDLTRQGLKLHGTDRHGQPIYVTDTPSATCLLRRSPPDEDRHERPWPRETR